MKGKTYTIMGILEEWHCEFCGVPLDVGDKAFMTEDNRVYCGKQCAEDAKVFPAKESETDKPMWKG